MSRSWLLAISLAPLLGASQTLLLSAAMASLSVATVLAHRSCMTALRSWLEAPAARVASLLLAAALITCQTLALQAWALELHHALGIYPGLIALQCVMLEQAFGKPGQWRHVVRCLGGLCALYLLLGTSRELLATGTLQFNSFAVPDASGLRLAALAPGALLLLGLWLALIKRACPKQATQDREGIH